MSGKVFADMPSAPQAPRLPKEFMDPQPRSWMEYYIWAGVALLVIALLAIFGYVAYYYFPEKVHDLKMMMLEKIHDLRMMIKDAVVYGITFVIEFIKNLIETGIEKLADVFHNILNCFRS